MTPAQPRTLRSLLSARRQVRPRAAQTRRVRGPRTNLTVEQVLAWANSHHAATGRWPLDSSGPVIGAPGELWKNIDYAVRLGRRGLRLAQHIRRTLDPTRRAVRPNLTIEQILVWADAHLAAQGRWPMATSNANAGAPGETWKNIDSALRHGTRGLPPGLNLRKLSLKSRSGTKDPATSS
jgi:hypothetical protein